MTLNLPITDTQILLDALRLFLHTQELREAYALRDGDRKSAREAAHIANRTEGMIEQITRKEQSK